MGEPSQYERRIRAVRAADDEIFAVIDAAATDLGACVAKSQYPKTLHALIGFAAKIGYLKNGIFDLSESGGNLYAINVLYRSLAEHHLRGFYVFVRALAEKTDAPGIDYFQYCGAAEMLSYARALETQGTFTGLEQKKDFDALVFIKRFYPGLDVRNPEEIGAKSNQFKFQSILRFLASHPSAFITAERPFLAKLVPIYAELSSYTHGGPDAGWEDVRNSLEQQKELIAEKVEWAFFFSSAMWFLALMVLTREFRQFADAAGQVKAILQRELQDS